MIKIENRMILDADASGVDALSYPIEIGITIAPVTMLH
jgi:hypothetical protein